MQDSLNTESFKLCNSWYDAHRRLLCLSFQLAVGDFVRSNQTVKFWHKKCLPNSTAFRFIYHVVNSILSAQRSKALQIWNMILLQYLHIFTPYTRSHSIGGTSPNCTTHCTFEGVRMHSLIAHSDPDRSCDEYYEAASWAQSFPMFMTAAEQAEVLDLRLINIELAHLLWIGSWKQRFSNML